MARWVDVLVSGTQLERGDQVTVALQISLGQYAGPAMVGTMGGLGFVNAIQLTVNGGGGNAV